MDQPPADAWLSMLSWMKTDGAISHDTPRRLRWLLRSLAGHQNSRRHPKGLCGLETEAKRILDSKQPPEKALAALVELLERGDSVKSQ